LSDNGPDFRRGIDWARVRAAAAQQHFQQMLGERHRFTWRRVASISAGAVLVLVLGLWIWIYWGLPQVPDAQTLWALNRQPSIMFVDNQDNIIGVRGAYYGRRTPLHDLPAYVPQAFIAIEDRRFYEHEGVDRMAILRAVLANLRAGETVQGASTISQQLARNLFLTPEQSINRKLREMVLASRIERRLTKDEILEMYLNRVYLGAGTFGVAAASRRYFGKSAKSLDLAEAAVIAGLPKAPSRYSPLTNPDGAWERAKVVLAAMADDDAIDAATVAMVRPPQFIAPVAGATVRYFTDWVMERAADYVGVGDRDLVVVTTLDTRLQRVAEQAVESRLALDGPKLGATQAALVALTPDGAVRALVGGRNYSDSQFNRAISAHRQPGSSFKPFVYLAALEAGLTPDTERDDAPYENRGWSPENYDGNYLGAITLRDALARSVNTVAVRVADEVGRTAIIRVAQRLGIASPLEPNRSLPLGTSEVTLYEMVRSFAAFANNGNKTEPYVILDVRTTDGTMLYEHPSTPATPVIAPQQLAEMNQMLFEVTQTGTGKRADLSPRPAAAKTGTSQDWRDAWFIGYTADLVTGVWVGNDDNSAMSKVVGGGIPATIWKAYMVAASKDLPVRTLPGIDMFGQTGGDFADAHVPSPGEDMPWVERGEGRRGGHDDRGVLENFLDSIFGGDDEEHAPAPPPPQERYAPRSELGPTSSTQPVQTPMASAPPRGPRVITVPAAAPPVSSEPPPSATTKAAESDGPYRQPQPDADAGSPF